MLLNLRVLTLSAVCFAAPAAANDHATTMPKQVAPAATDPAGLRVASGFAIELLYSVPSKTQGSWVSLTVDSQGRLIASDQNGRLYRVTPAALGSSGIESVESIDIELGNAQGLLCAFDSLYVMVNQSKKYAAGLYRVRDVDGDDRYETVEMLKELEGGGEHGPHGIVLSPDGDALYVIAGNATDLPSGLAEYLLPPTWQEDLLLPRNPAPTGHATGRLAPGGWVCRVSPDGKDWGLIAAGFRNPYDLAINGQGDLFTFDADMEHDIGAPWYRPTRVCHVVSGAEFGWRFGTGKWPAYNADSVPPTLNVGLGSPTGVTFGYGAKFPKKYRDALYVCDWTHGRLFAVHLQPMGASYSAEFEEFVAGVPLALTDIVVSPVDQAMYFTIGGRRTQSGLYRVTWKGSSIAEPATEQPATSQLAALRHKIEALHGAPDPAALDSIWQQLGHTDRFIRYAARIALEHLDPEIWRKRLAEESDAETAITAMIASSRSDPEFTSSDVAAAGIILLDSKLRSRQQVDLLRAMAITFSRHGQPDAVASELLAAKLEAIFPTETTPLDFEICKLLVYLDSRQVVGRSLALMRQAGTQEALLNYAMSLRAAKYGWTDETIAAYFSMLNETERKATTGEYVGSGHLQTYLQQIRRDAAKQLTEQQRERFVDLLMPKIVDASETGSPTPRKFVKLWTVGDLLPELHRIDAGRSYKNGKKLFAAAQCIACHRFDKRGGIFGPDLTAVAKRYSREVLLREIVEPSKQVSDQYQTHNILTEDGVVHSGRIITKGDEFWTVAVDPKSPSGVIEIPSDEIEQAAPSTVSMMPQNLLDTLTKRDIFDLFAYLESGGDPDFKAFRQD
ncbi:MAG: c-type cytochrome [Planctomycetota bacterium]